jgi:hypothetical protein
MATGEALATTGPQVGDLIPDFAARTVDGRAIVRREFKGRHHLVLCFAASGAGDDGRALIATADAAHAAWQAERAAALVVLPPGVMVAPAAATVPLVLDADGDLRARFGVGTGAMLLIADRYGEVVLRQESAGDAEGIGLPLDEVRPILELLEMRCSL